MFQITVVRKDRNLTQKELARLSGIDEANISRLEAGKLFPYPGWKKKLAAALGVDPEILFIEVKAYDKSS